MKYARIENNTAVDILIAIDGFTIEECYHPSTLDNIMPVDDAVGIGWTLTDEVWTAPPPPVVIEILPTVSAVAFRNLFTVTEEVAISASTDPVVKVLWERFCDPKLVEIDLNLASVRSALDYLSATNVLPEVTPAVPYLEAGRQDAILTGKAI